MTYHSMGQMPLAARMTASVPVPRKAVVQRGGAQMSASLPPAPRTVTGRSQASMSIPGAPRAVTGRSSMQASAPPMFRPTVMSYHPGARMSARVPCPPGCGELGLGLAMLPAGGAGMRFTPTLTAGSSPGSTAPPSGSSADLRMETFRARALKTLLTSWIRDLERARSRAALDSSADRRDMGALIQRANRAKQEGASLAVSGTGLSTRDLERLEEMQPGVVASASDIALINRVKNASLKSRILRGAASLKRETEAIVALVRKRRAMPSDRVATVTPRVSLTPAINLILPSGGGGASADSGSSSPSAPTPVSQEAADLRLAAAARRENVLGPQQDAYDMPGVPDVSPEDFLGPGYAPDGSGTPLITQQPAERPKHIPWVQIGLGVGVLAAVGGIFYLTRK